METTLRILSVAAGGALGAVARHLINSSPIANWFGRFPFATFVINVSGSFVIGFLLILLTDKINTSEYLRSALIVGFLGAFTTFSTFEMEIYSLAREKHWQTAILYLMMSVVCGFAGVAAGIMAARQIPDLRS